MMKRFVCLCIMGIALFGAIGNTFAQTALPPLIMKHPVATSTHAQNADLMLYVQALPRDEGTLSYQWYYKTSETGNPIEILEADGGTSFTLKTKTQTTGVYYYYCVVTNTNGTATSSSSTTNSIVTVINKNLYPQLMNGGFQDFWDFNGYTVDGTSGNADQDLGLSPKRKPSTGTGFALPPVAADVDNSGASYQKGIKYWNTTHANTNDSYSAGKVTQLMAANGFGNGNNYLDTVWTAPNGTLIRHNDYSDPDNPGPNFTASGTTYKVYRDFYLVVELCADQSSSLYQEVATVPGKIYEWSICHALRGTTTGDVVSVVIGPAINASSDYHTPTDKFGNTVTNRWNVGNNTYRIRANANNQYYDFSRYCTYPYGSGNGVSYFVDVKNAARKADNSVLGTTYAALNLLDGQHFVSNYNNQQYYVFISSADLTQGAAGTYNGETGAKKINWKYQSGSYSVPEGQGLTVFSFVGLVPTNGTAGNVLDNIVFKSGSSPVTASAMFYNGKVSLSAQDTKVGYVYGIAEVHGSTVTDITPNVTFTTETNTIACPPYDQNSLNPDILISHWYYPNAEGTITFEDLTPGKTYRIIGIPAGAVSGKSQLNTNKSPAEVLDDGYYTEKKVPAAWEGNDEQMATATASAVSAASAEIYVTNTHQNVEYALVDYELSPENPNYVVFPWTPGKGVASEDGQNGIPIVFDGLQPDHCYVVAARPGEYIEITYKEAAKLAPQGSGLLVRTPVGGATAILQDIQLDQIERVFDEETGKDKITLKDTDPNGEYGLYNPKTGYFLAIDGTTLQPGGVLGGVPAGAGDNKIVFTGLETDAIYHLTVKEKTTTTSTDPCEQAKAFMVGVRVYPFPATLQIDYVKELIFDNTTLPDTLFVSNEVEYRMQANATLPVVGKDYWLVGKGDDSEHPTGIWQDATGTKFLKLGETQNGNASLLDSIKILNAPDATFSYRLHPVDVDGWIGPSYAPENPSLIIPCRPDKPVINECDVSPAPDKTYTLDYSILPEKIIVNADSLAYSVNNGVKFTTIPNSNSDPVPDTPNEILLTALGWSVSPMTVPLRFPAIPDAAFASDTTVQQLLGRGPAPTTPYAEIIGTEEPYQIKILGLDDTVDYQYKLKTQDDTYWADIIATEGVIETGLLPMTSDYEIRFAPTCEKPASISQVLSVPLSIRTVNFGTLQYGYDATNIVDTIVIRNVAALDMPFDPAQLTLITGDNTVFSIIPRTDILPIDVVEGKTDDTPGQNKEYLIVPNPNLSAGNYHTTIQLTYNGVASIATADVYLTVERIQWPNDLEATSHIDPDDPTQFCLDIDPDPEKGYPTDEITDDNAIIEYSINDVYNRNNDANDDGVGDGPVTGSCFTGLIPAKAYDIYYHVKEDPNHYESDPKILTVKTPYALDCTEKVTVIDYKEEMLFFSDGSYRADSYTVSISLTETGPETEVSVPYQVSAEAETGFWVHVRHTGPDDFPESKSCSYYVAAREPAPAMDKITINGTNKTIALNETPEDEEFQYRVAGNANIMANWQSAFNITGTLNYGGYEIRRPAVATVGDEEGKFASKFTTATLLAPIEPSALKNLYVDIRRKDQMGTMNGTTWKNATPSLAWALDYVSKPANAGKVERIFVAVGTYKPDENNIDRTKSFQLPSNVIITGGYETSADGNAVPDSIHKSNTATILSGDLGIEGDASDNSYHVVDASGATNVTMKGFVITDGNADTGNGGGVYVVNGTNANTLKLINVDIHSNKATNGAGIYLNYGTATLTNVTISANEATTNGGGIYRNYGNVTLNNTIVYDNQATANQATAEIYSQNAGDITYNYSLVKNMALTGTNFPGTTDPLFVNPAAKDFRLSSESTVRNVGNDGSYKTARNNNESGYNWDNEADAAGKRRFRGIIDLGAYEALSLDASPTTICSGETSTLSVDPNIPGIYSTSKADSIIAIVGDGNILHSDVYVSANGELLDRPNHDVNEGVGGLVTVIFTANDDGNSATKKILVKPRVKTPTLRWIYGGICTVDESAEDDITVFKEDGYGNKLTYAGMGWTDPYNNRYTGWIPDSTNLTDNYFANYVLWDYIVENRYPGPDEDRYDMAQTATVYGNITWYDAGGTILKENGALTQAGIDLQTAGKFKPFWQDQSHTPMEEYYASITSFDTTDPDSCESRRIPVKLLIYETPEELDIPPLVGYVQPSGTLDLSNYLEAHGVEVSDGTLVFEWYDTKANADIVSNAFPLVGLGDDNPYDMDEPSLDLTTAGTLTYWVIRADETGCRSLPTPLHIQLFPMPVIEITADKSLICPGTEVTTTVTIDGGTAPYNFTLESGYTSPVYVTSSSETTHTFTWSPFNIATFTISAFSDAIPTASITAPYWDNDLEKVIDLGVVKPHPNYFAKTTVNMIVSAITSISPNFGPLEGGTYTEDALDPIDLEGTITIHGYGFAPLGTSLITKVLFGGDEYAADIKSVTDNTITCVPPPHAKGVVTVSVFACVTIQLTDAYHYEPVHIIDVSPAYGPVTGGTEVTIKGIGLWDSTKDPYGVRVWLDDKEVSFTNRDVNVKVNELHFTSAPSDKALLDRIVVLNGTGGDQREFPDRWTYYPVVFIKDGVWSEPYNWEAQTDDRILPYPGAAIQIKANILQDIDLTSENIVDDYPKFKMDSITVDPKKAYTVALGKTLNANVFTLKDDASFLNFGNMQAAKQNVEHLLTKGRNWYISSPVQGGTAPTIEDALGTGALGGDLTTDGNVVFTPSGDDNTDWRVEWYQESTHNWQRLALGSPFETGLGYTAYSANEDIAAKFSGIYADGDNNSVPINYTSPLLTRTGTDEKRGYNLVGNPFPSYWHWTEAAANAANLYSTIWYRTNRTIKKDEGEMGIYEFWSYNASGAVSVAPGWEDDTPSGSYSLAYVPPMQAFWVRIKEREDGVYGENKLTFANDSRAHADHLSNVLRSGRDVARNVPTEETRPMLRLRVDKEGSQSTDETLIYADEAAFNRFDDYDSDKWFTNQGVELFTLPVSENRALAINGLSSITDELEIPLGFQADEGGAFSFRAKEILNLDAHNIFLRDKWRNETFDLRKGDNYYFNSGSTSNTERFSIVFRSTGTDISPVTNDRFLAYTDKSGHILVALYDKNWKGSEAQVSVFDIAGRKLTEQAITVGERTTLDGTLKEGVYLLRAGKWSAKVIVNIGH